MRAALGVWVLSAAVAAAPSVGGRIQPRQEQAWQRYFEAPDVAASEAAVGPLIESGVDVMTVQRLLGHRDVSTTMIYIHVLNRGGRAVRSPADSL